MLKTLEHISEVVYVITSVVLVVVVVWWVGRNDSIK